MPQSMLISQFPHEIFTPLTKEPASLTYFSHLILLLHVGVIFCASVYMFNLCLLCEALGVCNILVVLVGLHFWYEGCKTNNVYF